MALRPGKRYLLMKIRTEVNQDQYLWQRIMPQWRITLVRQPRLKVAKMQLKKKLLMQEVTQFLNWKRKKILGWEENHNREQNVSPWTRRTPIEKKKGWLTSLKSQKNNVWKVYKVLLLVYICWAPHCRMGAIRWGWCTRVIRRISTSGITFIPNISSSKVTHQVFGRMLHILISVEQ